MIRILKKKYIISACLLLLLISAGYIYAVYNGYILLNNPSRLRYPIRGVDVSHYQGTIDWQILSRENLRFAYIKATEGSSHTDSQFIRNWEQVQQTKLAAGAYHFFSFDSPGATQAENFIRCVNAYPGMLPPVIDVEYYADKKENPPSVSQVRAEQYIDINVFQGSEEDWANYSRGK